VTSIGLCVPNYVEAGDSRRRFSPEILLDGNQTIALATLRLGGADGYANQIDLSQAPMETALP